MLINTSKFRRTFFFLILENLLPRTHNQLRKVLPWNFPAPYWVEREFSFYYYWGPQTHSVGTVKSHTHKRCRDSVGWTQEPPGKEAVGHQGQFSHSVLLDRYPVPPSLSLTCLLRRAPLKRKYKIFHLGAFKIKNMFYKHNAFC